jgi:iron complex transport system permease protein
VNKTDRRVLAGRVKLALWLLLPSSVWLGLASGTIALDFTEVVQGLLGPITGDSSTQASVIVTQLRLPRTALAGIIGAILASCGAAM